MGGFLGIVAAIAVGIALIAIVTVLVRQRRQPNAREPDPAAVPPGPTGTEYPTGARPAGPGAEGMAVPEPGDIAPGDPTDPPRSPRRDDAGL